MTLTQYIAIRSIIDYEIQTNKENSVLPQVVEVLLNHYDEYSEEERKKVTENVKTIAATASGGVRGENLVKVSTVLLSGFFAVLPVVVKATEAAGKAIWLSKILKEKDK
jgi:predicted metallopeptidase